MYYMPILLTIIANVIYHISQKYTPEKINPFFSLSITYTVALILSIMMYILTKKDINLNDNFQLLNLAPFILGGAIVLLEAGYLLAYRYNWNISTASLVSTICVTVILVPIGLIFFHDAISLKIVIGIILSILGIILISI